MLIEGAGISNVLNYANVQKPMENEISCRQASSRVALATAREEVKELHKKVRPFRSQDGLNLTWFVINQLNPILWGDTCAAHRWTEMDRLRNLVYQTLISFDFLVTVETGYSGLNAEESQTIICC